MRYNLPIMPQDQNHHLIKKYSNRKLYDTQSRRYITLDDIARMVRDGCDITVVQRDSGQDLTAVVLSQIVAREERQGGEKGRHGAPADALQERGQALLDYLRRTINMPAEMALIEVEKRRGDLEAIIDGAIARALKRLSIPTRRDIGRLNARIDALETRLQSTRTEVVARSRGTVAPKRTIAKPRTRKGAA